MTCDQWLDYTICPGCGHVQRRIVACQRCGYENGLEPGRLLMVSELLAGAHGPHTLGDGSGAWNGVNLVAFLRSYDKLVHGMPAREINAALEAEGEE